MAQGFFDAALKEAERGFRKTEHRDIQWNWRYRILEAQVYLRWGFPQQTLNLLAPEPPSQLPLELRARRKLSQGEAFCRLDQTREAQASIDGAQQLIPSDQLDLLAESALTRGRCTLSENQTAALQHFETAAKLAHGVDKSIEALALLNRGWILLQKQPCNAAIAPLSQALSMTDSPLIQEKALGNLDECYADLGDWKQSISFAEQAERLASEIKNASDQQKWLIDLGKAHLNLREFSEAEPYYSRALAIARSRKDQDGLWRCLNNLTQLALRRLDLNSAEHYWREEAGLTLSAEGRAHVTFDAATIAVERKDFPRAALLFKEILQSDVKDSLRLIAERGLGNVYRQEGKTADAERAFRQAIDDAEGMIKRLPPKYRMSFLDVDPFYDSYVQFLVAQDRDIDALRVAERGRAQILSQAFGDTQRRGVILDLPSLQGVLKRTNQTALAYSLTDDESFLWVVTPNQLKFFHLPSHKALRPLIDAYKGEIVDHHRLLEQSPAGQELYKTLIQPAESLIPKSSGVVIVTSKILALVNFEALIVPGPRPHYWIDDKQIETASSLALLARSKPSGTKFTKNKKELLLLGAPLEADKAFPALQNASDEMNRVRSHFPANQETIISGKDAIPDAYRANHPSEYKFIHIDAHSDASQLNPLKSFVVLSPNPQHSYKLFADEITETPLRADLVTLSACYGAGTRWYNGEGIVGLGWAFLRAGAHQVVASLWTVDDASTPQLMDDFYGELSKGKSAAEALRTAKRKMLHAGGQKSVPFYWASLQLYTGS